MVRSLIKSLVLSLALPGLVLGKEVPLLSPGEEVVVALSAGEVHTYDVGIVDGRRLVTVDQFGIDVVVRAVADSGITWEVDAPSYRQGTESLLVPADWQALRIEVRSASEAVGPGRYMITLRVLSDGDEDQRQQLAAEAEMTAGAKHHAAGARQHAVTSYEEALALWRRLGDVRHEASVLLRLGILHLRLGDASPSLEHYQAALALLRQQDRPEAVAVVLSDMGLLHWRAGENDRAQALFDESLVLQRRLGNRYGEAITLNNACLRSHRAGELRSARDCYQQALDLLRELGERRFESVLLINLGGVYDNLGEPDQALDHYRRALVLKRATGDRRGEARILNNVAVVYRRIGEMQQALTHYDLALAILDDLGDAGLHVAALRNVGFAYASLGDSQRAGAFLEESLRRSQEAEDRRGESLTLNVLGRVRSSQGETDEALAFHRRALELRRELGDRRGEAVTLNLLGRALAVTHPARAVEHFDRALALLADLDDRREKGNALYGRGEALLQLGKIEPALGSLNLALLLRRELSDPHGEAQTLHTLARAERRLGRLAEARRLAETAIEVIESQRVRVSAPDLRATYLATQHGVYELLIDLLMALHAREPLAGYEKQAFEVSERARARSLLDLLAESGTELTDDVDPELRQRRATLQRRLSAKADRRSALLNRGRGHQEAELELYSVVAELDAVEAEIRDRSPRWDSLDPDAPIRWDQVRDELDAETMLLEYALGEARSFLWAITAEAAEIFELPGREQIESLALDVARRTRTLDPRGTQSDREVASRLARMLLGPVADRLGGRRLVIVADGALHYVPFGVLPMESSASGAEPLITTHEVAYLPSASALAAGRRRRAASPSQSRGIAVLADPVFEASDPRLVAAVAQTGAAPEPPATETLFQTPRHRAGAPDLTDLHRLPATRAEAEAIAAVAPAGETRLAVGFDADRGLALGDELRRYRLIHFATHGLIDDRRPELSGLVLSRYDANGRAVDGFLRLRDVYTLDLDAELVVLSGCRTALGREVRGEGLVGLTHGFMVAGVPRVVASLWPVEDRVTAELMGAFYRAMLSDGLSAAAALRRAQLSIAEERQWRDPYYWGAFVLQGDWR